MNKKHIIIFSLVIVIIFTYLLFFLWSHGCEKNEKKIKNLLEEANFCEVISDCLVYDELGCPFGCYNLVNKEIDLNHIEDLAREYNKNCDVCIYDCMMPPKENEIMCKKNKCVDIRFEDI